MEILKKATVVKRDRSSKGLADVLNECDVVAIYFSAHWCPPCRMFTPVLADVYKQLKNQGKKLEVVFVSSDKTEDAMFAYMEETHGDWYAIKYNDAARSELGSHFGVRSIPTLIILKKDGTVISKDGRSEVQSKGTGAWELWTASAN
ncbi:nucleoredoxin-like protein 2 isoform X2 [Varroa jacobsoni]|nr:nucleoredoxin-like protein 2 isoform X2 [Varroa destructor]XP_022664531.1 nucleoredoxin-like protein 2 isoform X2 [Varroa destructor]XP_022710251.1 nucleoredoxin-like protein 2 isoform X2 [Varroa jacobsoni]XP_022710252.1 nucleoredoxin-like protein 2 isoform X2 [Varroa jacobsoni]